MNQELSISKEHAQELTSRIKSAANDLWQLLTEAHEKKAYKALGYSTWAEYVKSEFDMSRGHSYRLLNQGAVIKELGKMSPMGDISERDARKIKPHIAEIKESVSSGEPIEDAVYRVIEAEKEEEAHSSEDANYNPADDELEELRESVRILAEENEKLKDGQIIESSEYDEESKMDISELISDLRNQIKKLEMELRAVKSSRDHYQRENGEMKKQMAGQRKEIAKLKGVRDA